MVKILFNRFWIIGVVTVRIVVIVEKILFPLPTASPGLSRQRSQDDYHRSVPSATLGEDIDNRSSQIDYIINNATNIISRRHILSLRSVRAWYLNSCAWAPVNSLVLNDSGEASGLILSVILASVGDNLLSPVSAVKVQLVALLLAARAGASSRSDLPICKEQNTHFLESIDLDYFIFRFSALDNLYISLCCAKVFGEHFN